MATEIGSSPSMDGKKLPSLNVRDPVIVFTSTKFNLSPRNLALLHILVSAIGSFGIGSVLSYWLYQDQPIIRVFDSEHLYYGLFVAAVLLPVTWFLYLWQPHTVAAVIANLEKNGLVRLSSGLSLSDHYRSKLKRIDNSRLYQLGILLAVLFVVVQIWWVWPHESAKLGRFYFWHQDKVFFYLFFIPNIIVGYYIGTIVAFRFIWAMWFVHDMFRNATVDLVPLDPDGAGGLSTVGNFAIRHSSIAVGLGVMASVLTVTRVFIGGGWGFADEILLYVLYLLLVPVSLVLPIWTTHRAMVGFKNDELRKVSNRFQAENITQQPSQEALKHLQERYVFIRSTYPVWPISTSLFRQFSIKATIPLVTGFGSVVIEFASRHPG